MLNFVPCGIRTGFVIFVHLVFWFHDLGFRFVLAVLYSELIFWFGGLVIKKTFGRV